MRHYGQKLSASGNAEKINIAGNNKQTSEMKIPAGIKTS